MCTEGYGWNHYIQYVNTTCKSRDSALHSYLWIKHSLNSHAKYSLLTLCSLLCIKLIHTSEYIKNFDSLEDVCASAQGPNLQPLEMVPDSTSACTNLRGLAKCSLAFECYKLPQTKEREKSNPSRRLPCQRISEITSKRKETFHCLMPLCSTSPWLWILEARKDVSIIALKYPVAETRPFFLPCLTEGKIIGMLQKYGDSDILGSCSFAEVWKKKKKKNPPQQFEKSLKERKLPIPKLLSHPEHWIFNLLVWKHPWMSPHTVKVQICGSVYETRQSQALTLSSLSLLMVIFASMRWLLRTMISPLRTLFSSSWWWDCNIEKSAIK